MSKSIDDIEFKISRLDLRDGDILVIKVATPLPGETRERLRDYVAKASGGHQVMILDGAVEMSVLTAADVSEDSSSQPGGWPEVFERRVISTIRSGLRKDPKFLG